MGNRAGLDDLLAQTGEPELGGRFRAALARLEAQERQASGPADPSGALQRAWADVRSAARSVAAVTGVDPLALDLGYDDITAVTGDGALAYVAAAKAGGYALVIAARHDPQFVDLPGSTGPASLACWPISSRTRAETLRRRLGSPPG